MKKILVLNFHSTSYPPSTGGELRFFHFYNELSHFFDITLLSPTHLAISTISCNTFSPTFREVSIPDEPIHCQLFEILKNKVGVEYSGLVRAISSNFSTKFHNYFNELYLQSDIIIHDHPYMLGYDLYFGLDDKPRIYNSYNYEAELVNKLWNLSEAEKYVKYITELEERLVQQADLIFAVSEEEMRKFIANYHVDEKKIALAPNGVISDIYSPRTAVQKNSRPTALFIGSKHPPNILAASFIINILAEQCKGLDFIVVGDCCYPFQPFSKSNVKLMGRVDEITKQQLLAQTDIAINPMFTGAGTNLKTLEFLSAGIPLISTHAGVRGLELVNGEHYILADENNFAQIITDNLFNLKRLDYVSQQGKEYVNKHYTWNGIAARIRARIDQLELKKKYSDTILVLNSNFVSGPDSGGSERVYQLGNHLSKYYRYILLTFSNTFTIQRIHFTQNFIEISIPKTVEHTQEESRMYPLHEVPVWDIISSNMASQNDLLVHITKNLYNLADAVILSQPYMVKLLEGLEGKPVIYESQNCETELKKSLLTGHPEYQSLIQHVSQIEKSACLKSNIIISVAQEDRKGFTDIVEGLPLNFESVPNGSEQGRIDPHYDISSLKKVFKQSPIVLFVGSSHPPNVDAMNYINTQLAPLMPEYFFMIIGSACYGLKEKKCPNLLLFYEVERDYKDLLMTIADIAINPVLKGSGSNIKIADYFAKKIPTITTSVGARGYPIVNGKHALIGELHQFKAIIEGLVQSPQLRQELADNAFDLMTHQLDWAVLAAHYGNILKSLIRKEGPN